MTRNKYKDPLFLIPDGTGKSQFPHVVISWIFYNLPLCIFLVVFLVSCAGTRKGSIEPLNQAALSSFFNDSLETLKAFGTIELSMHGERYRGAVAVSIEEWARFSCELYTPFAQTVVAVSSDKDSAAISIRDQEYRIGIYGKVATIPFFTSYPFIFSDVIRILTGRLIFQDRLFLYPAEAKVRRHRTVYEWQYDSLAVAAVMSRDGRSVKRIAYRALKGIPWKLEYTSFKNGISKEIYFESEEKNYFSLVFDEIKR